MSVQRAARQPSLLRSPTRDTEPRVVETLPLPLPLDELVPGRGPWEVELGFGKGRYLLRRAGEEPESRFLGIELVSRYWRLAATRAERRGLGNLLLLRGEALYLLCACLPPGFARALHVYFPDPWPKSRHHKRRFLDPESVDLVLRPLRAEGRLYFASDHPAYGREVEELLAAHPALEVEAVDAWPEGPRTNYEAKYVNEGRPIVRLVARLRPEVSPLHPRGKVDVLVGPTPRRKEECE